MPHPSPLVLPIPEPLALLHATALFVIQVLLAQHPELLAPPEEVGPSRPPHRSPAYLLLDAVRELQYALEVYRSCLTTLPVGDITGDDDIPF
jgi:hypothetical protein